MHCREISLLCGLIICFAGVEADATTVYGRTAGNFGVSNIGSAQYSIPLWAPPGPRGIQPKLALAYDSNAGIGIVGVGWSIAGLGSIYRCNQTFVQDTVPAAVALAVTDGYCINGNRLRRTSGTYGTSGSTYQTEIADFSNITAVGTAGNGPQSWTVQARNGLTYYYGLTDVNNNGANSATPISTSNPTVPQWFLSKVVDRYGNNYVVNYRAAQDGTTEPDTIYWTPTSAGASSYTYTIKFNYNANGANAPQSSPTNYIAGNVQSNSDLLSSVVISYGSTVLKDYVLTYETGPTQRDRLKTVAECADTAQTICFPTPITMTYQNGTVGITTSPVTASSTTGTSLSARYDLNGDGYPDLIYANGGTVYVALGSSSGYGAPKNTMISSGTFLVGNLLGGPADGILANNNGTWYYYTYNGSTFPGVTTKLTFDTTAVQYELADVDGDGLPDLVSMHSTYNAITKQSKYTIETRQNTTSTTLPTFFNTNLNTAYSASGLAAQLETPDFQYSKLRRYDFDGDGRDDLVLEVVTGSNPNTTISTYELLSTGTAFTAALIAAPMGSSFTPVFFTNWNDDACTDFVSGTLLYISGCNGTSPAGMTVGTVLAAMDWDGDGRTDLVVINGTYLGVYLSSGSVPVNITPTTFQYSSSCQYVTLDADGDGLDDLGCWSQTGSSPFTYYVHSSAGVHPDLVTLFNDGYGVAYSPTYKSLVQSGYTRGSGNVYPQQDFTPQLQIVTQNSATDGIGGNYTTTYGYMTAVRNLQGRGFEGFGSVNKRDSRNSIKEVTYYSQTFPTTGMLSSDAYFQPTGSKTISATNYYTTTLALDTDANNQRVYPYYNYIVTKNYEVGGSEDGTLTKTTSINYNTSDNYGNFASVETTWTDNDTNSPYYNSSWTSTTASTFSPDAATWCLNLPSEVDVTNTAPSVPSITRHVSFVPDYSACQQTGKTIEPNNAAYALTEAYKFDSFGNVNLDTVSGVGITTRQTTLGWGTTGQFLATLKNAYSQTTTWGYDPGSGVLTSQTDPNGIQVQWQYDPFFRKSEELRPDGTTTTWAYNACGNGGGCVNGNNRMTVVGTVVNTDNSVLTTHYTYLDSFDRVLVTSKPTLPGTRDRYETQYDNLGNVHQVSEPCTFSSCTPYWTVNAYDLINRLSTSTRPISATNSNTQSTTYAYQGRSITVTDAQGKNTTTITKVTGSPGRTTDHNAYSISFNTDAFGSVLSVTDSQSHTLQNTSYQYGIKAFPQSSSDVDLGSRSYTFDALGELTAYTDAKSQQFLMTYDLLSRLYTRKEPDTASSGNFINTMWNWGTSATSYNIGKLQNVTSMWSAGTYVDAYTYDSVGRISDRTMTLPTDGAHSFDYTYSTKTGLLDTLLYPTSASPNTFRLSARYVYGYGILEEIYDGAHQSTVWWSQSGTNIRGQTTQEITEDLSGDPQIVSSHNYDAVTGWLSSNQTGVGGGSTLQNESYLYDLVGNVTQRQNGNAGLTENFYYDNLYRLDHSVLGSTTNLQMCYDNTGGSCTANLPGPGNITSRSDIASATAWTYDTTHLHAVTQAGTGTGSYSYTYDANGNAITRNGLMYGWTSYNYPSSVYTSSESATFDYAPDRSRWRMSYTGSAGLETTYYVTPLFEKVIAGGVTDYRHYIYANGKPVVVISRTSAGAITVRSLLLDHQGSVASVVTDSSGASLVSESFTAFGNRREASTWSDAPTSGELTTMNGVTREGFTFQTVLGSMGLNHMNGRIEDAVTGRFLSADPFISAPGMTQSYNRYSYVNNNPLSLVDPSGFIPTSCGLKRCNPETSPGAPSGNWGFSGGDALFDSSIGPSDTSQLTAWVVSFDQGTQAAVQSALDSLEDSGNLLGASVPPDAGSLVQNLSTAQSQTVQDATQAPFPASCDANCQANQITVTTSKIPVPATGGNISWGYQPLTNYSTLGGTSYGANIALRYNGNPRGLAWQQVMSKNGAPFTQDSNSGGPNYYTDSQLAQSNVTGPNFLAFYDQPSALPGNVTFNAQTSLVSLSSGMPLITISWGYQLNGTAITLLPLTYFYPSK